MKYHSCDYKHQRLAWLDYSTTTKGFQENLIFWWELLNNPPILLEIKKEGGRGISNKRMDNTNNLMGYM